MLFFSVVKVLGESEGNGIDERKKILLGVTGGIAAFKAASLCSKLVQQGAEVRVIMTESATKFITELTLQALSKNPVYTDTFDEKNPMAIAHIDLADWADLVLIAPATANIIGKMAAGIADDMLSTTLLATQAPIMLAPAMNVHMYVHPAVTRNLAELAARGVMMVEPGKGCWLAGTPVKGGWKNPRASWLWCVLILNVRNSGIHCLYQAKKW